MPNETGPVSAKQSVSRDKYFRLIISFALSVGGIISILNLTCRLFDIPHSVSSTLFGEPMKLITSVCFIITIICLLVILADFRLIVVRATSIFLSILICCISIISLCNYFYLFSLESEPIIFQNNFLNFLLLPEKRMAFLTACSFMLIGSILLLLQMKKEKGPGLAHLLIIPLFLINYFIIISYILKVYTATEITGTFASLYTAIVFWGLMTAILFMFPDTWLLKRLTSRDIAGIISRKLLPPLIILPLVIGWLRIYGERIAMFKSEEGVIIVAVAYAASFLIITWFVTRSIEKIDYRRRTIEEDLRQSEERFKAIAEVSPVGMGVVNKEDGRYLYINPAYEQYFGYEKDELLSRKSPDIYFDADDRDKILGLLNENNFVSNYEVRLKRKDGSSFWSMSSIKPIKFTNKPALLGAFIDISKRKQAEDSLRISEQRLKSHIENSPLAVIEWGPDFVVAQWSHAAERIFGFTKSEVIGLPIDQLNLIFEDDIPLVIKTMERLTSGKELNVVSENRNYTKKKEIRNCIWYNSVLLDEMGQMASVMSLVEDVTEIRVVEKLLKESEEKLWSVLNATQESIYMFDSEGRMRMSNSTGLTRINKQNESEVLGHHFSEFVPPQIAISRQEKLDEVFKTGKPLEFEDERNNRMYSHNFFPVNKDGKVSFVVTFSTDITKRKTAEANLKESEDRLRTIAESLPVLISIFNIRNSTFSFVNEAYENTFGFKNGELINKKLPDTFFNQEDFTEIGTILKSEGRVYNKEIRVKHADGTPFWIMSSTRQIKFMNEPSYLTASINITETKKTQEELLRLNRTLDAHNKSSQAMMHSKDEFNYLHEVCKIIIEDCGHTMVWVGYAQNDENMSVIPVAYYGFDKGYIDKLDITWDDSERGRGPTGTAIRTGKPSLCKNMMTDQSFLPWREAALNRGYASSLVLPLILEGKPFGSISIYSKEPNSFSDSEIILLSKLADDLAYGISYIRLGESERSANNLIKENETKLKELIATKDKFFNIVAHDLKNPFTSLLGSSELLYENIDDLDTKNIHDLALILHDSAKSGYAILQNLLDWSRSQTGLLKINSEKVNLRILIDENICALQLPAVNKQIEIYNEVTEDIFVFADKNMINTILRNLLSNALKFTYKCGNVTVRKEISDHEVTVSVKDNGIGIPEDKIDSLFHIEVKNSMPGTENELGTGLGLKLSKEFIEKLGGRIWVEHSSDRGSDFRFTIPLSSKAEA
jgi:PAS domain S-box-containing protein